MELLNLILIVSMGVFLILFIIYANKESEEHYREMERAYNDGYDSGYERGYKEGLRLEAMAERENKKSCA